MRDFWVLTALFLLLTACGSGLKIKTVGTVAELGIIADCQYADAPTGGIRHYRLSPEKLGQCIGEFNTLPLSHIFHLGDFIDKGGMGSLDIVLQIMQQSKAPHTLVLGNHDFEFPDDLKWEVPALFGLRDRYFSLKMDDWRFLVLDGNDVSLYAWPEDSPAHLQSKSLYDALYPGKPTYNGALGSLQMDWLVKELKKAEKAGDNVILLCHFPLLPKDNHVLWNADEILALISGYSCVKAWLNGHNHAGAYVEHQGIHFVTFQGMVDTEENAYATIRLTEDEIIIQGRGREPDRRLKIY